jgi:hypothetical protein
VLRFSEERSGAVSPQIVPGGRRQPSPPIYFPAESGAALTQTKGSDGLVAQTKGTTRQKGRWLRPLHGRNEIAAAPRPLRRNDGPFTRNLVFADLRHRGLGFSWEERFWINIRQTRKSSVA